MAKFPSDLRLNHLKMDEKIWKLTKRGFLCSIPCPCWLASVNVKKQNSAIHVINQIIIFQFLYLYSLASVRLWKFKDGGS